MKNSQFAFLTSPWGLKATTSYAVDLRLIEKLVMDILLVIELFSLGTVYYG